MLACTRATRAFLDARLGALERVGLGQAGLGRRDIFDGHRRIRHNSVLRLLRPLHFFRALP